MKNFILLWWITISQQEQSYIKKLREHVQTEGRAKLVLLSFTYKEITMTTEKNER